MSATEMRVCGKCEIPLPKTEFSRNSSARDGLQSKCKGCFAEYYKQNAEKLAAYNVEYYKQNAEKLAAYNVEYRKQNAEKLAAKNVEYRKQNAETIAAKQAEYRKQNAETIAAKQAEYYKQNAETIAAKQAEYVRNRLKNDPYFRLEYNMRSLCRKSMVLAFGGKAIKSARTLELMGVTSGKELMGFLSEKFWRGMTFENYGLWHVDHIRCLASFDLNDPAQQRAAWNHSNLQPLWAEHNLWKSDRDLSPDELVWLEELKSQGWMPAELKKAA